jgi:hypothetical protein
LVLGGIIVFLALSGKYAFDKQWNIWIEAFSTFALIIITIVIWYNEQKEAWVDSLPKRLNVSFWIKNVNIMNCENAVLINESDIRAWGQQIGAQMGNTIHLSFELRFEIIKKGIQNIAGSQFVLFELKMYLKVPPETIGLKKHNFDKLKTLNWEFSESGELIEKELVTHCQDWPNEVKIPDPIEKEKKNLLNIIKEINDLKNIKAISKHGNIVNDLIDEEIESNLKKLSKSEQAINEYNV